MGSGPAPYRGRGIDRTEPHARRLESALILLTQVAAP
jgi:hypothetical protein